MSSKVCMRVCLQACRKQGEGMLEKRGPAPSPCAPGSCSAWPTPATGKKRSALAMRSHTSANASSAADSSCAHVNHTADTAINLTPPDCACMLLLSGRGQSNISAHFLADLRLAQVLRQGAKSPCRSQNRSTFSRRFARRARARAAVPAPASRLSWRTCASSSRVRGIVAATIQRRQRSFPRHRYLGSCPFSLPC